MTVHDARLAVAALVTMIACAIAAPTGRWWMVTIVCAAVAVGSAFVAAVIGGAAARLRSRRSRLRTAARTLAAACALAAVVTGLAGARAATGVPATIRDSLANHATIAVTGTAVSDAEWIGLDTYTLEPRWRLRLAVATACEEPCARASAPHPLATPTLTLVGTGPAPQLGDAVGAVGTLGPSRTTRVMAVMWSSRVSIGAPQEPLLAWADAERDRARDLASGVPERVRPLVLGMVIGDTAGMDDRLDQAMRRTGLTHLTAVSGSHFAILWACLIALARRAGAARSMRRLRLPLRALVATALAGAMVALAVVVLPEPSVARALTMALAGALGWWLGRPARAVPALGAGLLILLVVDPGLAGALGLQLSVAAVLGIVLWSPFIAARLERWLIRPVAQVIAVPTAAWLACLPLLAGLQGGIGLATVPANLVAGIAAAPVTVLGVAALVAGHLWTPLGEALMQLAGVFAWPVLWTAHAFAEPQWMWIRWPLGAGGAALGALVTAAMIVASTGTRLGAVGRAAALAVAVGTSLTVQLVVPVVGPAADDWVVVVCDVGQGDAMLIRTGEHAAVMVDTGPPGGAGAACLDRYGVDRIDLLVLTHPHADHDGAVAEVTAQAQVEAAWISAAGANAPHDAAAAQLVERGIPVQVVTTGVSWEASGAETTVSIDVLGPDAGAWAGGAASGEDAAVNDASVALWIEAGGATVIALGDLETAGQRAVAERLAGPVVVDIVKVAHHGSATQDDGLAEQLTARAAIISVGQNSYGHPSPPTVRLYEQRATVVVTTLDCGDLAWTAQGELASACGTDMAG